MKPTSSTCIYCGSRAYGPGCPYSPHGRHVHAPFEKKCIYCGSSNTGPGCPYNPAKRKIHVHGVDYNSMIKDSVQNSIISTFLIQKLNEPITESQAYKLGIVNEHGKKIKDPETLEELNSYTLWDEYVFNIKQVVKEQLPLINNQIYLNNQKIHEEFNKEEYTKKYVLENSLKESFKQITDNFSSCINDALQKGLTIKEIEKILFEIII